MAVEGTIVSRKDYFQNEDSDSDNGEVSYPHLNLEFTELNPEDTHPPPSPQQEQNLMEFNLFSTSGPTTVNLDEPEEEITIKCRPIDYYVYAPTPQKQAEYRSIALSGEYILNQAEEWLNQPKELAPDINADYRKPKKCRPGKQARINKKRKHEAEKELKKQMSKRNRYFQVKKKQGQFRFK